eukprot:TRINITY_DN33777_c0_g1_i1.p1 TRINITY_DN33777_c0_g1~~TRINITY_DN33777_c0_g1_i1.p1  ORF type:complete len:395 (+),score=22.96 TRINITY_DN33777_c0_g1_i1:40-1224(+)
MLKLLLTVALSCTTSEDCALNGDCVNDTCICDPGWGPNPAGGLPCSYLQLDNVSPNQPGYKNESANTWGGRPVYWEKDQQWHVFTAMFSEGCSVDSWKTNSFIFHATGPSPTGPWTGSDVSIPIFAHNPQALLHPDGTWIIYFIGGWHISEADHKNCSRSPVAWPSQTNGPGMGPTQDGCGPGENTGCGIRYATSPSPYGPWTLHDLFVTNGNQSALFNCTKTNPAPTILANGTVLLAFNGGYCHSRTENLGIMSAPHYTAPFTILTLDPIASTDVCAGNTFGEDPTLWQSKRGFHLLGHAMCNPGVNSLYAFSRDAVSWTFSRGPSGHPLSSYTGTVHWTNGSQMSVSRMERPIIVLSPHTNTPFMLTNAIEVKGRTWGVYRMLSGATPLSPS